MKYCEINENLEDCVEILTGRCILRGDDLNSAKAYTRGWLMAQLLFALGSMTDEQQVNFIEKMRNSALYVNVER